MNKLLTIKNLGKVYHTINGEVEALKNINLEINKGEFICIVGSSGCGKSTLLSILADLDTQTSGEIIWHVNKPTIGYMLQNDTLFPWLSIYKNACLGLDIKKLNNKSYVDNLLKTYSLYDFKDKKPNELSGGMKQRVALIRTLAIDPDILFLDEPFSALDYQTRLAVSDDVYKIIKKENKTVIMITHDIAEAISLADRIIILSKRPGTVKKVYEINLTNKTSPINNRNTKEFPIYYSKIWKDLDVNVG
ncbi:MAG: ABC transporter ATP-binding protein [Bacilli bacterium]|nr:ABC transporter ATP-binding protein [Bacilli bacterium]